MKAAIFDMDGTLIDSLIFWNYLWKNIGETFLHDPDFRPDEVTDRECRTVTLAQAMKLVHDRFGAGQSSEQLVAFTAELLENFYREVVLPKPGVREFLEYLKEQGVRMCIATASEGKLVPAALKRCGLEGFFEGIFSCAQVGKGKEHPDVFLLALEHLGTAPGETWMFEDSYVALQTAKRIGMPTVGIYDKNNYGQDILRANSDHYIAEGEALTRLIGKI